MSKPQDSKSIVLFEDVPVRRIWVEQEEKWYFAIVDIIKILTDSKDPQGYIKDMRRRDSVLSQGWGQIATPLLVETRGGKQKVNCANVQGVLRIIQSIPSKKAEPFKQWLAKVGYERLQETVDPERALNRARKNWKELGRSEKWIEQRMRGQETRNKLTDYWQTHGVNEQPEYAQLTNIIHKEWSGLSVGEHKKLKKLKQENLRDNMTEAELIFTALAEFSTRQIANHNRSEGFVENAQSAKRGGKISAHARQQLEQESGEKVVSAENFLPPISLSSALKKSKNAKKLNSRNRK
ncbi:MAG: Bro-N domain-containing protein [Candidatus Kerfeldbacteria bacterium]|nr:Bro-N domain-containing protein [Candidatus Kerfeldbacteria bacterium]